MHSSRRGDGKSEGFTENVTVKYHKLAGDELLEAARYYETCQKGLGTCFLDCIDEAISFLKINPDIFKPDKAGRRKYLVKTFPYLLIYKLYDRTIFILAVAHTARKPGYWKKRDT